MGQLEIKKRSGSQARIQRRYWHLRHQFPTEGVMVRLEHDCFFDAMWICSAHLTLWSWFRACPILPTVSVTSLSEAVLWPTAGCTSLRYLSSQLVSRRFCQSTWASVGNLAFLLSWNRFSPNPWPMARSSYQQCCICPCRSQRDTRALHLCTFRWVGSRGHRRHEEFPSWIGWWHL